MSVAVIHDTKGAGVKALEERLRELARSKVLIGVPAGKTTPDGGSLAEVAATVEFGHTKVHPEQPERPFLRGGIREAQAKLSRVSSQAAKAVAEDRMGPTQALELLGMGAVGEVKKYMAGPHFAKNEDSTIAKKKSSQPTIDTGQLRQSITHVVDGGGA